MLRYVARKKELPCQSCFCGCLLGVCMFLCVCFLFVFCFLLLVFLFFVFLFVLCFYLGVFLFVLFVVVFFVISTAAVKCNLHNSVISTL